MSSLARTIQKNMTRTHYKGRRDIANDKTEIAPVGYRSRRRQGSWRFVGINPWTNSPHEHKHEINRRIRQLLSGFAHNLKR